MEIVRYMSGVESESHLSRLIVSQTMTNIVIPCNNILGIPISPSRVIFKKTFVSCWFLCRLEYRHLFIYRTIFKSYN